MIFLRATSGGIKRDPHLHFIPQIPEVEPPVGGRATPFTENIGALHEYNCDYMRREALQDSNSAESFFGIRLAQSDRAFLQATLRRTVSGGIWN
jgi:hypothetical protein